MPQHSKRKLLTIDGAMGEGGGQIPRSSLALSLCLGKPFHMTKVRATTGLLTGLRGVRHWYCKRYCLPC